ncbi:hypothetical protein ACOME3_008821 [Neoechinorhynchus agilis]
MSDSDPSTTSHTNTTTGDELLKRILEQQQELLHQLLTRNENPKKERAFPFRPFEENKETWAIYKQQLSYHFAAQGIVDDSKKRDLFLSWIGPPAYQLITSLCAGKGVEQYGFQEVLKILDSHYTKPVQFVTARFVFNQCEMKSDMSYAARDKALQMIFPSLSDVMKACETYEMLKDTMWKKDPVDPQADTNIDELSLVCILLYYM